MDGEAEMEAEAEEDEKWEGRMGEECGRMKDEARSSKPLSSKIDHMSAVT